MKIRSTLVLAAFLFQALTLTACGGGSTTSNSSSPDSNSSSSSESSNLSSVSSSSSASVTSSSSSSSVPVEFRVFKLYEDGPSTLVLETGTINSALSTAEWEQSEGNVVANPQYDNGSSIVWDVQFSGMGNVQLIADDMSEIDGADGALRFQNLGDDAALVFELLVISAGEDLELLARVDSGWPANSYKSIDIPETGSWTTVTVPFSEMIGTSEGDYVGEMDLSHVVNPFVLESTGGTAHVQIDNVRIVCEAQDCDIGVDYIEPLFDDFDVWANGAVGADWARAGDWNDDVTVIEVEDSSGENRGEVLDITFNSAGFADVFVENPNHKNLSAFANEGSYISYDIRILDNGTNKDGIYAVSIADAYGNHSMGITAWVSEQAGIWP